MLTTHVYFHPVVVCVSGKKRAESFLFVTVNQMLTSAQISYRCVPSRNLSRGEYFSQVL